MSQKIQSFKLTSGEEIIAKVVRVPGEASLDLSVDVDLSVHYILADVRAIIMQPTGPGQMGIGMMPWMASVPDGEVKLHRDRIMGEPNGDLPKSLEDGYLQQTSGIQIASGIQER